MSAFPKIDNKPILLFDNSWSKEDIKRKSFFLELSSNLTEVVIPFIDSQLSVIVAPPSFANNRLLLQWGVFERSKIIGKADLSAVRISDLVNFEDKNNEVTNQFFTFPLSKVWSMIESHLKEETFVKFYFMPIEEKANAEENITKFGKGPLLRAIMDLGEIKNLEKIKNDGKFWTDFAMKLAGGMIEWLTNIENNHAKNVIDINSFLDMRTKKFAKTKNKVFQMSEIKNTIDLSKVPMRKLADFAMNGKKVSLELSTLVYNESENSFKMFAGVKSLASESVSDVLNTDFVYFTEVFPKLDVDLKQKLEQVFLDFLNEVFLNTKGFTFGDNVWVSKPGFVQKSTKEKINYFGDQLFFEIYAPHPKVHGMNQEIAQNTGEALFEALFRWVCIVNFTQRIKLNQQ